MNDSGFWIVCKLSGFTEKETLKSWTVLLTLIAVVGLIETLIFSKIVAYPFGNGG
jgi:GntP family gluconate:H+ symporter